MPEPEPTPEPAAATAIASQPAPTAAWFAIAPEAAVPAPSTAVATLAVSSAAFAAASEPAAAAGVGGLREQQQRVGQRLHRRIGCHERRVRANRPGVPERAGVCQPRRLRHFAERRRWLCT